MTAKSPIQMDTSFLSAGGEMGALIAGFGWWRTPIGPLETWPQSLKSTLSLLLRSPAPMALLWGDEGVTFYNDAYIRIAGDRHPLALGLRARKGWRELAEFKCNCLRVGLNGGTLSYKDQELTVHRNGRVEQIWLNLDCSPVLDEHGKPVGVIGIFADTTERVLAEKRLKDEHERLAAMFQQTPGFACKTTGPDHVFELANDAYRRLARNRPLIGLTVREAWPELEGQGFYELLDQVYATGQPYKAHRALIRMASGPGGEMKDRYLDFIYQPVFGPSGEVTGIFTQGCDVTRQARAEQALRESQELLESLTDALPGLAFICDREGGNIFVNRQYVTFTGCSAESLLGSGWLSVVHPDDAERVSSAWSKRRASGEDYDEQFRLRDSNGTYRWFLVRVRPVHSGSEIVRWVGVAIDIDTLRVTQAALRHERAKFATVLEHLPVGVWYLNQDSSVAYANPQAKEIWAGERPWHQSDCKGWWRRSGRPIGSDEWMCIRALNRGESSLNEEIEIEAFNGIRKAILSSAFPVVDYEGAPVGAIVVNQDISKRIAMEDALREAKSEADRASLAKSKFLATASHDLRQPVQSLVLFLASLKGTAAGTNLERPIQFMEQAVEALNTMLAGLLDLSRLDACVAVPKLSSIDAGGMVQRLGREYAVRAAEQGLKMRALGHRAAMLADSEYLERTLRNLIENALRYTQRGGVLIACRTRGTEVRIDVIDSGIGISPEHQQTIFDEYVQVGNEARERAKGLGLGLAIVRRLVHLMGGRIEVRSRLGYGSRFSLVFPVASSSTAESPAKSPCLSGEGKSAVVIEDEEMVRASLRMMLESWGFNVIDAEGGREAITRLGESPESPAIIIADYRLKQGETGLDAVQGILQHLPHPIPTAIITGDTEVERIKEVHGSGFLMLHKPIGAESLKQALSQLLPG